MLRLRIILLLCLVTGALTQEFFDLSDALDDVKPATPKPEQPKAPEKPKDDGGFGLDLEDALGPDPPKPARPTVKPPKSGGGGGFGLDLEDALGPDPPKPAKPTVKPPKSGGGGGFGLDLEDALGPDPNPPKPTVKPPHRGGGGGAFDDSDLVNVFGGGGGGGDAGYKPDGGRSGGGGGADPDFNSRGGGADEPQAAGSGQIAGIASAVGMALLGAASSYFAYQKKKLCFKVQGGADPERGKVHHGNQSDGTQIFSNLLRTS